MRAPLPLMDVSDVLSTGDYPDSRPAMHATWAGTQAIHHLFLEESSITLGLFNWSQIVIPVVYLQLSGAASNLRALPEK